MIKSVQHPLFISLTIALLTPAAFGQYFPMSSLGKPVGQYEWYSAQLSALGEPSLFSLAGDSTAEAYRFTWLRSFHHPIAVRLTPKPDGTGVLTVKIASGAGGFRPGLLSQNTSLPLTQEQTQRFRLRLQQLKFWSLPNPVNDGKGTDGSEWIIEGVRKGRYHVVDRWTPTSGPVRELGEMLAFEMAKLTIPKNELY